MENIIEKLQIQEEIPESKEAATVEDAASEEMARKSVLLYHVMAQTSKALRFCQSRQEFFGSAQHVEAERLLLFAGELLEAWLMPEAGNPRVFNPSFSDCRFNCFLRSNGLFMF